MDDVIENCQTTFEEDGVNQQTLDDLRKVGLFPSGSSSWSIFLHQLIIVDSALSVTQSKRFVSFDDTSFLRLAGRNVRSLRVGKRSPGICPNFWGDAEHLTLFYAAPRYFSLFFLSSRLPRSQSQLQL